MLEFGQKRVYLILFVSFAVLEVARSILPKDCGPCTRHYAPVCGSDGKKYGNECMLKYSACMQEDDILHKAYDGPCHQVSRQGKKPFISSDPQPEAIFPRRCGHCTKEYDPVCGSNGQTYGNLCMLEFNACRARDTTLVMTSRGRCQPPTHSPAPAAETTTDPDIDNTTDTDTNTTTDPSDKPSEVKCDIACTRHYDPVCGSDGKSYPNKCMVEFIACKKGLSSLTMLYHGLCVNERKTKARNTRGREQRKRLKKKDRAKNRDMTENEESDCKIGVCPADYQPVCGSDNKTYSNQCQLGQACKKDLTKLYDGPCEIDKTRVKQEKKVKRKGRNKNRKFKNDDKDVADAGPCTREKDKLLEQFDGGELPTGTTTPACDQDGYFLHQQCSGSTGACWCVNKHGKSTSCQDM